MNSNKTIGPTLLLVTALLLLAGCGTGGGKKQNEGFFTSGSKEADQRASQTMAKSEQLSNSGEGAGEKGVKPAKPNPEEAAGGAKPAQAEGKMALFDRLGGEQGINAIIDDFLPRAMQDPRVNWERKGNKSGGFFHHSQSSAWNETPENVASMKKHFVQFLALATGGPPKYDGKEMKAAHAGMHISNPEFDAAIGDLKASLDKLQIPNKEQKELLSIIESTRPEIVTER